MDYYSTHYMAAVVRRLKRPTNFLLDTFFPNIITFDTEEVNFDVEEEIESIVPYCSPLSEGTPVKELGFEAKIIKPAYMKPKTTFDPTKGVKRLAGERIGGAPDVSKNDRTMARLANALVVHLETLTRTREMMVGELISTGKLIIEGEKYPRVELDYGRDAALSPVLAGVSRWGEAGVSPYDDLLAFLKSIFWKSGAAPTDVVFTGEAFDLFMADEKTKDKVNTDFRGMHSSIEGVEGIQNGAQLQGTLGINGTRLWTYMGRYRDPETGTYHDNLPENSVTAGSAAVGGMQLFGAIIDDDIAEETGQEGPIEGEVVVKSWTQKDPGVRYLMSQSSFVPGQGRPDAMGCMIVR